MPTMDDEVRRVSGRLAQLDPAAVEPNRFRGGEFSAAADMDLDHARVGDGLIARRPAEMDLQFARLGIRGQRHFRRALGFADACSPASRGCYR